MLEGQYRPDGTSWQDGCNQCRCDAGRVTCGQVECDCDVAGADRGCCPQCYDRRTCSHQDIPGLAYGSGHKWVYRCSECECMVSTKGELLDTV